MSEQALWQTAGDRTLTAKHGGFHLVVAPMHDLARFQVWKAGQAQPGEHEPRKAGLLASGHSSTVKLAMQEAERVAGRLNVLAGHQGAGHQGAGR